MTNIYCLDCDHIRETTEDYPTLAHCVDCGSHNVAYTDENPGDLQ